MGAVGDNTAGGVAAGLAVDAAVFAPGDYVAMGPFVAAWAAGHAAASRHPGAKPSSPRPSARSAGPNPTGSPAVCSLR